MDTKDITFNVSNIFFPKATSKEWILAMTRRTADIFDVIRQDMNDDIKEGIGLISLDDIEVQRIIYCVNQCKDYVILGEAEISLVGTSIVVTALIIDTI